MTGKYFLAILITVALTACNKDKANNDGIYVVSASKMIAFTGSNWNDAEPQVKNRSGYDYRAAQPGATNVIKADVYLPAVDDSSKIGGGILNLNVAPDNLIKHATFRSGLIAQSSACAMMLNYHRESLKLFTGVTLAAGSYMESNMGGNMTIDAVLSMLRSGQTKDQLSVSYNCVQGGYSMVIFRQSDGRCEFVYSGNKL